MRHIISAPPVVGGNIWDSFCKRGKLSHRLRDVPERRGLNREVSSTAAQSSETEPDSSLASYSGLKKLSGIHRRAVLVAGGINSSGLAWG